MRVQRGFTIIELLITLVVMGILLVLGVADFTSSQAKSRDTERQTDVSNISSALESYYTAGGDTADDTGTSEAATNTYPSGNDLVATDPSGDPAALSILRDLDTNALKSPNGGTDSTGTSTTSLVVLADPDDFNTCLTNNGGITAALSCITSDDNAPSSSNDVYLYVPYTMSSNAGDYADCDDDSSDCVSYSLFYWSETQNKIIEVDSRHND